MEKNSKAGNEFDLLQYTEGITDKGMVGRTLQFKHLTKIDSKGDIGGFLPSLQLNYYKNFLNTTKGIQHMKSIYSHSHPGDGRNPIPSGNDLQTAENPYIPIPTFKVYSGGVYNTFKP
ncbi:hypothetical protein LF887_10875 [Chryseobacterium sp. MEBOG06]|uniref:hypothetical protein n=1 Tax=Chryseobacterium sp. MEBOG06 TaxID=2879938 RepID=UPI001F46DECD|nr:hypothetical protein [Chryseobacterium sp. MEBOG06]UKB86099.1 hypothetical protein LF887_10875 [Chryseobacterium sp. MEBOG06]